VGRAVSTPRRPRGHPGPMPACKQIH